MKLIRIAWLGCQNDMQSSLTRIYLPAKQKKKERKQKKSSHKSKNEVVIVTRRETASFWKSPFDIALNNNRVR